MTQLKFLAANERLDTEAELLLNTLKDMASRIKVKDNYCIHYENYKPLELADSLVAAIQKMPVEIQAEYRRLQLRYFIYGSYYNGHLRSYLAPDKETDSKEIDIENDTFLGINIKFYDRLHQANSGTGFLDPDWLILREENDGSLAVTKRGLRLHIERSRHLTLDKQAANVSEKVSIRMPKNMVQNGFYMAIANLGETLPDTAETGFQLVRIYFNLIPEGAVKLMATLTAQLNEMEIYFSFKVLYNPDDYNRYDSGVLYFQKSHYEAVRKVLQLFWEQEKDYLKPEVPLFTKKLAPGVALAEDPAHYFATKESFGMQRCQLVANGFLETWNQDDDSPELRLNNILKQFSLAKIDWQRTYLNPNSEDIYAPLKI